MSPRLPAIAMRILRGAAMTIACVAGFGGCTAALEAGPESGPVAITHVVDNPAQLHTR